MRFRFLGGSDAPDWLLAEVSVLSKMSSVRMKLIARQIINQLSGHGVAYDKITKLTSSSRIQLEPSDIKALIAALHYVYASAVRWSVEASVLLMELEQLGLPKDVCTAMVKEYQAARDELRQHMKQQTLSSQHHRPHEQTERERESERYAVSCWLWVSALTDWCAASVLWLCVLLCAVPQVTDVDWRVDYVLASSALTVSHHICFAPIPAYPPLRILSDGLISCSPFA